MDLSELPDDELRRRVQCLARLERGTTSVLLRHLAEIDGRRASDGWGFPSLFVYCTQELRMSAGAAYRRIAAARAADAFPDIYGMLESGELSLETITLLRPYLTRDNAPFLLERARGKSKRDVELMLRTFDPRADVRDFVMRLPGPSSDLAEPTAPRPPPGAAAPPSIHGGPDKIEPLSQERVHFGFTGSIGLWEKIERIKELLRHKHPRGKLEDVVDEMAERFLDARDPARRIQKRLSTGEAWSRAPSTVKRSRRIPPSVRDAVWSRDGGQCAFVAADGTRCAERGGLEYDHIIPWAMGGRSDDAANIRLLCRTHNQHAARELFGAQEVGPHRRN